MRMIFGGLAVLATISISSIAVQAAHAQTTSANTPSAFYVSEFQVTDAEGMKPYSARVASTFQPFGGRYIVRSGKIGVYIVEGAP